MSKSKAQPYKNIFGETVIPGKRGNPMIPHHGRGPEGKRCKHCIHLLIKHRSRRYFKCFWRGDTRGPGTDHRWNWPSCGKFEGVPGA